MTKNERVNQYFEFHNIETKEVEIIEMNPNDEKQIMDDVAESYNEFKASELSIPIQPKREDQEPTRNFAWYKTRTGISAMIWYGEIPPSNEGEPVEIIWGKKLEHEDVNNDLYDLMNKYKLNEVNKPKPPSSSNNRVMLIDYTGAGHPNKQRAIDLLIFAKSTRLEMNPRLMADIISRDYDEKLKEVEAIANTIPSSWEFIDYTWLITGVTRAFTHQLVRTRHASFAQQTMRVLNVSAGPGWDYAMGPSIANPLQKNIYRDAMDHDAKCYKALIQSGAAIEDARGVLPTNILTNILMKCNLRTLVELVRKRSGPRVQGEYREVKDKLLETVKEVHPWIILFTDRTFDKAAMELDEIIKNTYAEQEHKNKMHKLVDQMRGQS